jgi:mannose-6-phosphate isomerase-like protein (cupin superfamily)
MPETGLNSSKERHAADTAEKTERALQIPFSSLVSTDIGSEFEGHNFGYLNTTFIIVEAPTGTGPKLHSHPYPEIFIVLEGMGRFTIGEKTLEVSGGNVLIVPADTPHKFVNIGNGVLKQVDIHLNERFVTIWLE